MPSRPGTPPGQALCSDAELHGGPWGRSLHPWTLPEKEASFIQGRQTLRVQTLQLHLLPHLASVLVNLSISLTAHAWSLLSITCLDETHPLAHLPSSLQTGENHTMAVSGCVRVCQGHCGWRMASARPPSPLCTSSLLPESASLWGPSHPGAPHPPDPGVPRNQKPSGERSFTFLFCFLQTRRLPRA